jgi:hypothetical protein
VYLHGDKGAACGRERPYGRQFTSLEFTVSMTCLKQSIRESPKFLDKGNSRVPGVYDREQWMRYCIHGNRRRSIN